MEKPYCMSECFYLLQLGQKTVYEMIQTGVGIVEMFGLGSLYTPASVLAVLLLQAGQTEASGDDEADDDDPHGELLSVLPWNCVSGDWLVLDHVLTPHTAPPTTDY